MIMHSLQRKDSVMTGPHVKKDMTTDRIRLTDDGAVIHDLPRGNAAGQEFVRVVDECARAYAMSWSEAFEHVRASQEGREILRRYGQRSVSATRNYSDGPRDQSCDRPDIEIDWRARAHMDNTGEASYAKAVACVLNADPELRRACARFIGRQGSLGVNS
jgi:hypothetical protein